MNKVRVRYTYSAREKCYPYHVDQKTGFFTWTYTGSYKTLEEALQEAKRLEKIPSPGQILYETVTGYD